LLAMANSLATRQNSPRGPTGPPDCAARGVYVGDGEIWRLGNERRRLSLPATPDRSASDRPGRIECGRRVVVSPSGHRHPETRRGTARRHSSGAEWRRCHDPGRAASRFRQVDRCFSLAIFLRRPLRADRSGEPSDGPTTRPDVIRASRGPSYDSPGKSLTQPTSESTVRTQSEFVTRLK
jgi:hypothetical protein